MEKSLKEFRAGVASKIDAALASPVRGKRARLAEARAAERQLELVEMAVREARRSVGNAMPVFIVDECDHHFTGLLHPAWDVKGDSAHYTTMSGRRIKHPAAYSSVGWSSMIYHPSTNRIVVYMDRL
jgi:hypothetical protein